MAASTRSRDRVRMNVMRPRVRPLPVVLPPLRDELLSSWVRRHAAFYNIGVARMLRHCLIDAVTPRTLDLTLTRHHQLRLAETLRCDPQSIARMTQWRISRYRPNVRPHALIATVRPAQICRRCFQQHKATAVTLGARLRSWMEGWRLHCPVCGFDLEDVRAKPPVTGTDSTIPFIARMAHHARRGETLVDKIFHWRRRLWRLVPEVMRILLMPSNKLPGRPPDSNGMPRMLNVVVPGFDDYVRERHPDFRPPGNLVLPMNLRRPLLVGVNRVMAQPREWVDHLLGAASIPSQKRVWACLKALSDPQSTDHLIR
jgi:TniQ